MYQYTPSTHSISLIVSGDKRELIRNAVEPGNISVTSAPWIIIPFWDKNVGSQSYLLWWWYESGAIVHNILLEATALNMSGNVLSVISDQNGLRSALGISGQTNLVAFHVALVGHTNGSSYNNPPATPTVSGPSQGINDVLYNYTVNTTDSDGDDVFYYVDWDDGSNSGWVGPFSSGVPQTFSHSWIQQGTYGIKARAKDSHGLEGSWSTPLQMTISGPGLDIEIKRGLGFTAIINNSGTIDVTNVTWKIVYEGGFVFPAQLTGTFAEIRIGEQFTLRPLVFGLGKKTVTVSVTADDGINAEETVTVFLLLVFAVVIK